MANKTSGLVHIGTTEIIDLLDDGFFDVPAKIDTGADSSAIWASNIRLEDGKLYFNFFAPGSALYRDEPVVSTAFRTTTVKNSFGVKEFRYKVRIRVRLGKHKLNRWFSLADRSNNTYPILLGKNFLKNKFVVDVAQRHLHGGDTGPNNVLVLAQNTADNSVFFEQVSKLNTVPVTYDCLGYDSLVFYIDGNATRVEVAKDGVVSNLASYNYTFFKDHHYREFAYAAAEYLHFKGRPFADREFLTYMSSSKLSEYMKLACYGVPVPASICATATVLQNRFEEIAEAFGLPFVLKAVASDRGKNNYLIAEKADFLKILEDDGDKLIYLAQKYIPNDGFYRVYTMGKEVSLAIWRASVPHENRLKAHLNKPRGSANASNIPLDSVPGAAQDLALMAASCMNRQIAGVDLVQHNETKEWYVLEANNDPQIRSGSFVSKKAAAVADFFDKELN